MMTSASEDAPGAVPLARLGEVELDLASALRSARLRRDMSFVERGLADLLVRQDAAAAGLVCDPVELQAAANRLRRQLRLFSADETHRWLTAVGFSVDDLEALVELDLLRAKLAQRLDPALIDAAFAQQRARFDRVRLSRLAVAARGMAEELLLQIEEDGADFRQLAMTHAVDGADRDGAGYLGWRLLADVEPAEVRAALAAARPGDVLGPFAVGESWMLCKLWDAAPATLDDTLRRRLARELYEGQLARRAAAAEPLI